MTRRDPDYWQRLRRDVPSNVAAGLAALAVLVATLCVVGTAITGSPFARRADPAYWLLMLPMAWWVSGLATFGPRYVRSWKPVLALAALASLACAALSLRAGGGWTVQAAGCAVTIAAAAGSLAVLRRSLVAREGPAR